MKETLVTNSEDAKKRLDVYLAEKLKERFSRTQIRRFINDKKASVNGEIKKAHHLLKGGQTVELLVPDIHKTEIVPEQIPLDIVYEDDDILVVNKPAGMVVHPAAGNPRHTLLNAVLSHTKGKLSHLDSSLRPGIVHRLDKEVRGLMVIAKTDASHKFLVEQFQTRSIRRKYIAFVRGRVAQDEGIVVLPIGRAVRDRKKMAVRFLNSKEALTRYKVLKRFKEHTKLEISLETGRTHQIRVHMSYMGYPVVGDTKYGGGSFRNGIALYAAELTLIHPRDNKQMRFSIDMPEELKDLEKELSAE